MTWPMSQDYNEAIQNPADAFSDADLRRGDAAVNVLGIPLPRSGNFADVYEVRTPAGRWAIKCFTREVPGLRERYAEISRALREARLPFTVDFRYLAEGIFVCGRWRPVLKMEWVEGLTLNEFVAQAVDKPATLEALLQIWVRMAGRLRAANLAHCDLQHGNIMLVPGANAHSLALKLIDYDGMWVPALAGMNSGEVGHPSYQHPQRMRDRTYSPAVDRFPLLLIATALRALMAGGQRLWEQYDNGDNLLFREADLREPKQSALFHDLLALGDSATTALTRRVLESLAGSLESAPPLEEVIAHARRVHLSVRRRAATLVPSTVAAAPDPWDFDAVSEPDASAAQRSRRRWSVWQTVGYLLAGAPGAVLATAVSFAVWTDAKPHQPEPTAPEPRLVQKTSPTTPASEPSCEREAHPVDTGFAKRPVPSDVPPAYPGKVHGSVLPFRHNGAVRVVLASRAGQIGFSLDANGVLYRFNAIDGSETAPVPLNDGEKPRALAASPDGRQLLTAGDDGRLHLHDLQRGTAKTLAGRAGAVTWLDVSADGKRALSCGEDGVIRLWNLEKEMEARHWPSPGKAPVSVIRFTPGGWRAISSSPDHAVRAWDLAREVQTFLILGIYAPDGSGRAPVTAVFFPDGRSAAVGMTDGTIDLWDLETREVWKTCPAADNPAAPVRAVAVSPAGRLLASVTGEAGFLIWDLENPAAYPCATPPVGPECLAFTSDGRHVLAGCIDGTIRCWAIAGLKETAQATGAALSAEKKLGPPSGALVAGATAEIRKAFPADYVQLDDAEDFHDLAVKRLEQARRAANQPLRRYALYREARDLAARGEDAAFAMHIVEEMSQSYMIDLRAAKVETALKAGGSVGTPTAARAFLDAVIPHLTEARADDAYAVVAPLFPEVERACSLAADAEETRWPAALVKDMTALRKEFDKLQADLQALRVTPADPGANQAVGEFYCLRKQNWGRGLRALSLSRNHALAAAAAKDAASPTAADAQTKVGDAWWELGKSNKEFRAAMWRRAYVWYNRALPKLVEKEAKRVADRTADLCQRYSDLPTAWDQLDVSKAAPVGDAFLRLKPGQAIGTRQTVVGPVEITVDARGAPGDAFFQCRERERVVVVWETRMREKAVHVRLPMPLHPTFFTDAAAPLSSGRDSWTTFTCTVAPDGTACRVNGKLIPTKDHSRNDVWAGRTFQLEAKGQQLLEVKSFTVKPLQP